MTFSVLKPVTFHTWYAACVKKNLQNKIAYWSSWSFVVVSWFLPCKLGMLLAASICPNLSTFCEDFLNDIEIRMFFISSKGLSYASFSIFETEPRDWNIPIWFHSFSYFSYLDAQLRMNLLFSSAVEDFYMWLDAHFRYTSWSKNKGVNEGSTATYPSKSRTLDSFPYIE